MKRPRRNHSPAFKAKLALEGYRAPVAQREIPGHLLACVREGARTAGGLIRYVDFYNRCSIHQSHDYQTPDEIYNAEPKWEVVWYKPNTVRMRAAVAFDLPWAPRPDQPNVVGPRRRSRAGRTNRQTPRPGVDKTPGCVWVQFGCGEALQRAIIDLMVGRLGLEPRTKALKGPCSTN